jgi:hypothetical protein
MNTWLRDPFPLTNAVAIFAGLVLGLLGATGILLGAQAIDDAANARHLVITRAEITDRDVAAIARRIWRLERPTRTEVLHQIRRALRACRYSPSCLERLDAASQAIAPGPTAQAPGPPATPPRRGHPPPRGGPAPPTRPEEPAGPVPPRPPTTPPTPPPPAPGPPPPVGLRLPPIGPIEIPPVCTRVVAVNC